MDRSDRDSDVENGAGEPRDEGQLDLSPPATSASFSDHRQSRRQGVEGISERLGSVVSGENDEDWGFECVDGDEGLMQWLRALDLQVFGACRADERLKPLLKRNVSTGAAEDRLLAQLSQHFEVSEVGMLARCLCIPLVSIRVGKVDKQGNLLCPTTTRGKLNLNMLPSSNIRISFTGDNGFTERLALLENNIDRSNVIVEEITADVSGRCFLLKLPNSQLLYYWCSEKSMLYGRELLVKMKDLLQSKHSLSDVTGIPQSRLNSFVTHLRAYVLACPSSLAISTSPSNDLLGSSSENEIACQPSCIDSKNSQSRVASSQAGKVHSSCCLSPRLNSFKDGMSKTLSHIRNGAREKLKRRGDGHLNSITTATDCLPSASRSFSGALSTSTNEDDKSSGTEPSLGLSCLDIPSMSSHFSLTPTSAHLSCELFGLSTDFSPYYCWCPPYTSSLQHSVAAPFQPVISSESLTLPPLSSVLSDAYPAVSSVPSKLSIDFAEFRALTLPALLPDPLIPIPLSVSSFTLPSSQQIPTFTPFMSDPIVHIPVIDVCSSGQGYFVSGGPAISSVISPLLPVHVNPLIPKTESAVEKNARETLEMLIASAPAPFNPQFSSVFPNVLDNVKKLSSSNVNDCDTLGFASCWQSDDPFDYNSLASLFSYSDLISSKTEPCQKIGRASGSRTEEHNNENECDDPPGNPEHPNA